MRHLRLPGGGRADRGMVTAEIAVGLVALALVVAVAVQVIHLVILQTRCADTASAVARQLARSDADAAARASNTAPPGARVQTDVVGGHVVVTVHLQAGVLGVGRIPLAARAEVVSEPGAAP